MAKAKEQKSAESETPEVSNDAQADINARLDVLEAMAHSDHHLSIGETELQAILDALLPSIVAHVETVIRARLGHSGQPVRGDEA